MKKILITIATVLCVAASATGQSDEVVVKIYDPVIEKVDENVTVSFRAVTDRKTVRRNYSLVFAPMLTDGVYHWSLPAVVVQGRGSKMLEERHLMASGREVSMADALFTTNQQTVDYKAQVPYQLWMDGARLVMEGINVGCCSSSELAHQIMVDELVLSPPMVMPEPEPLVVVAEEKTSTGDKLTEDYAFIRPFSEYEEIRPGELYDEDRENAIFVSFQQGSKHIITELSNNRYSLSDLMSSIRTIESSPDSKVKAVVIAGFASPEGTFELNDRLAWNRAVAVKEYIVERSGLNPDMIKLYNGSEDWRGLRALVEASDMYMKQRVLDIIDNVPVWNPVRRSGRHDELKRLDGGEPYRYMYKNFFPLLRNAAYIKVYYENK